MKKSWLVLGIVLAVLIIDQSLKIWVKTHMVYGEMIPIFGCQRAILHFVENEGMAFGKVIAIPYGKLLLSLFRVFAAIFLAMFLRNLLELKASTGLLVSFSLILAGAIGNIIDSAFYGLIFSTSYTHGLAAEFLPIGGGYGDFLYGKVVDMFYFPLFEIIMPPWLPRIGGESVVFFGPVFNIADFAISWGVLQVLLFHRNFFKSDETDLKTNKEEDVTSDLDIENM